MDLNAYVIIPKNYQFKILNSTFDLFKTFFYSIEEVAF